MNTFRPVTGTLQSRDQFPARYTWDVTAICPGWDEWTGHYQQLEKAIESFKAFQGTLGQGPAQLLASFRAMDAMGALSYRVWYFASLHYD